LFLIVDVGFGLVLSCGGTDVEKNKEPVEQKGISSEENSGEGVAFAFHKKRCEESVG